MKRNILSKFRSSSDIFCVLLSLEKEKVKVKVALLCLTLCDPKLLFVSYSFHELHSPWNSPGQTLEWVTFSFSRGSSQPRV